MPMPSVNDLQTMYGSWNPQAYLEAQSNAGLERQYRESEYARQQELAKQAGLETVYQEQNNPLRLEQSRLTNQNLGYTGQGLVQDNRKRTVEADIAEGNKQYKLNEAQRKDLLEASEQDIKMGEAMARKLMMSLDPEERRQGEQLYGFTKYARDEKTKHEQAMEKERFKELQATGRALEQNRTNLSIAEIGARSRVEVAGKRGNSIPKPPNTPIAQYLADLRQAYAENKIDEDTYNRSVARAVDAQFAAQTAGRTGGVELSIPTGGGSPQLAPKPAAPTLPPIPSASNKNNPDVPKKSLQTSRGTKFEIVKD